jgi:hypothetical protein
MCQPRLTAAKENYDNVHNRLRQQHHGACWSPRASGDESQSFSNAKELTKVSAEWPASRLVDTWNSFAGVAAFVHLKPLKKFTSRKDRIFQERRWGAHL